MRPPLHAVLLGILLVPCPCAAGNPRFDQEPGSRHDAIQQLVNQGENVAAVSAAVEELRGQLASNGPRSLATLDAIGDVATSLRELGDFELAGAVWQIYRVAATEIAGPRDVRVARAIYNLGVTSKGTSSEYDDILPYYKQALALLDSDNPDHATLIAEITRSEGHYYRYRDRAKSVTKLREALGMFEHAGEEAEATDTRIWLAWTRLQLGEHAAARKELESARSGLIRLGMTNHLLMGVVDSALADLDALAGNWSAAEQGYRRATRIFEHTRKVSSTRFAEFPLHAYNLLALSLLEQGRFDEAWLPLQRYRSPAGVRLLELSDWRSRSPQTFAQVEALRHEVIERRGLRRLNHVWTSLDQVDWKAVVDELDANARLAQMESDYTTRDVVGDADVAQLQKKLAESCAYVGWLDARIGDELLSSSDRILYGRWMFVVRSSGPVHWVRLWEYATGAERVKARYEADQYARLLKRACAWALRAEDDPAMASKARLLETQEFEPAMEYLHGATHLIAEFYEEDYGWRPLELLIDKGGRYLGERFAITYSSSAAGFVHSLAEEDKPEAARPTVLGFGDPVFSTARSDQRPLNQMDYTHLRSATNGDPQVLDHLPRLPSAQEELANLKKVYPTSTLITGATASEKTAENLFAADRPTYYNVIHFSTHALAETPLRQRCALALSRPGTDGTPMNDGLVDALEIQLGWKLDANLVTLSGCQTASGSHYFRGEPTGLAGVLMGVGARSVLASVWKVDDLATTRLMERFYENLSGSYSGQRAGHVHEPMPKDVALAEAKNWLRTYQEPDGRRPFAHPVYWSGFILMGNPN